MQILWLMALTSCLKSKSLSVGQDLSRLSIWLANNFNSFPTPLSLFVCSVWNFAEFRQKKSQQKYATNATQKFWMPPNDKTTNYAAVDVATPASPYGYDADDDDCTRRLFGIHCRWRAVGICHQTETQWNNIERSFIIENYFKSNL